MNHNIRIDREEIDDDGNSIFFTDEEIVVVMDTDANILDYEYDYDDAKIIIKGDCKSIYILYK